MEARFERRFDDVRVHDDTHADNSARRLEARAFTSGSHIVFADGEFAPHTSSGRRLLAHELAHVVQLDHTHSDVVHRRPATAPARPATQVERLEFIRDAIRFVRQQGEFFAVQTNVDVSTQLRHLKTTLDAQMPVIALVSDLQARQRVTTELREAYTEAVRVTLLARTRNAPGTSSPRSPPTLRELYERHLDEIEAFALPQAVADVGANELSDELTAALPARANPDQRRRHAAITTARERLRVLTGDISFPIEDLFSTRGGTTTIPLPTNTAARFSSTVPSPLQRGLTNVAGQMMQGASPILISNSTVIVALDLTEFGGGYDAYRFTRVDLGAQLGVEVWIERQGSIGVEGVRSDDRTTLRAAFDGLGFRRGSGFRSEEFDQVLVGVGDVPASLLSGLRGLRFERASASRTSPDAAAEYDQEQHTITVFDRAFTSGRTRFGGAGRPRTFASTSVVHEIGHALDLSALRTTAAATTRAQAALLAVFGTGGGGYTIPAVGAPGRARYDTLRGSLTQAERNERAARALSGARWAGNPATVTDAIARGARQPAFRAAATRDGGRSGRQFPTTYPNPDSFWQEYFAESFAIFITNPGQLQRIRPNVFAFMQQQFP